MPRVTPQAPRPSKSSWVTPGLAAGAAVLIFTNGYKVWWLWIIAFAVMALVDRWTGFHARDEIKVKTERRYSREADDEE